MLATLSILAGQQIASAASGTWKAVATDGNWATAGNWSASPAPTAADTATFNAASNFQTITIDSGRTVKSITFTTATGNYTIGSAGLNAGNALTLAASGTLQLASGATGTGQVETINAPLTLAGNYTFTNARLDATSGLIFNGNIANSAASVLTISGAGTGANVIAGNIGVGVGQQDIAVTASAGSWEFKGANAYAGTTTLSGATTLIMSGTNSSAGATVVTKGTLQLNNATNGGLASGLFSIGGASLQALNAARSISNDIALTGTLTTSGTNSLTDGGTLSVGSAARSLTNNIDNTSGAKLTLNNITLSSTAAAALTIAGSGDTTIGGTIADSTGIAGAFTINNSGTTTLSGANSYTGATVLSNGTIILATKSSLGAAASSVAWNGVTVQATSDLSGANALVNTTGTVGGNNTFTGSNNISVGGTITLTGTRTMTNNLASGTFLTLNNIALSSSGSSFTLTLAGSGDTVINGSVTNGVGGATATNLIYSGTATLKIAGTNTNGGTTSANGTVNLASGASLGGTTIFAGNATSTTAVTGTFNMLDGSSISAASVTVGNAISTAAATGTFNQAANTSITLTGGLVVGKASSASFASSATYNQNGGTINTVGFSAGGSQNTTGTYYLNAGTLTVTGQATLGLESAGGTGYFIQNGGAYIGSGGAGTEISPAPMDPAMIVGKRGLGSYTLNDGTFSLTNPAYGQLYIGAISSTQSTEVGSFTQNGGTVTLGSTSPVNTSGSNPGALAISPYIYTGTNSYTINGGTLGTTSISVNYGGNHDALNGNALTPVTGMFKVHGSTAQINVLSANTGNETLFFVGSGGTLAAAFTDAGFSEINVGAAAGGSGTKAAAFASGSLLSLSLDGYMPTQTTTWNVLTADTIVDGGLALTAGTDSAWSFGYSFDGTTLLATYTVAPEPTSLTFIGGLAMGGLLRRRSRKIG